MPLMRVLRGNDANLASQPLQDGYIWYLKQSSTMYLDAKDEDGNLVRKKLSAEFADKLRYVADGTTIELDPAELALKSELFSGDYADLTGKPTKLSDFTNDKGFVTESELNSAIESIPTPDVSGQINAHNTSASAHQDIRNAIPKKVSDLSNDAGYITSFTETDPTVPAWAKATSKPSYTAAEVGADAEGAAAAVQKNLDDHEGDTTAHVTSAERTNWNSKYTKPNGGIPKTDLASDVQTSLGKADTAIQSLDGYATEEFVNEKFAEIPTPDVSGQINTHNTSATAHSDIRTLISELTTKVNNFLDVDDTTTDQLSEVLALIEANEGTLESLTSNKVNVSDIINNLTTNVANKPLSAAQGVILKGLIDDINNAGYLTSYTETDPTVPSWAKQATKPKYTASEVGALPDTTVIPSKTSQLTNDSGYLTAHQDISGKLDKAGDGSNVTTKFTTASSRVNLSTGEKISVSFGKIAKWFADLGSMAFKSTVAKSDLASDVQTSLGKADTALQSFTESDPTVPAWAKAASKPTYTYTEVGADKSGSAAAVQTNLTNHDANTTKHITAAERTAWNAKSNFSGNYNDLTNKPTIPAAVTVDSALSSTSTNPVQNKVINSALAGKAPTSHGNHVPATETANNAKFLRNDNTWQLVTPANIGAATASNLTSHTGNKSNPHGVTAAQVGAVPTSRTVNGKALSANISITASDVGAAASSHDHDGRYYTEAEADSKFGAGNVLATAVVS